MEAVGLLLLMIGVSHGVESFCDGRQDGAQCFGALGGTVNIQLIDDVLKIYRFQLKKDKSVILLWRNNKIISNTIADRSSFSSSNETFKITNLNKEDSGQYELETFNSNGSSTGIRTLQFTVEAGVSSVQLVSECLSEGQKKVSCSSEGGDSPQYSWTLDGHTLTDSELVSGNNQTNIIVLRRNISGRLICSVWNQVSLLNNETIISTCEFINCTSNGTHISGWVFKENNTLCDEPTTVSPPVTNSPVGKTTQLIYPTTTNSSHQTEPSTADPWYITYWAVMVSVLSVLVFLLVVGVAVICSQKKKTKNKVEEDNQELTYADVRIMQKQRREEEQKVEVEVEYGQVKFSKRPRQPEPDPPDSVYAQVRKAR